MNIKITLFLLLFISPIFSQTIVLKEDFQQGIPSTWTKVTNDIHTVNLAVSEYNEAWISALDPQNDTNLVASSTSYFTSPNVANRWLISPAINLGEFGNYISWKSKSIDPSFPENYLVLISTSNNSDLANFTDTLVFVQEEDYNWTNYSFNLSELNYNNQSIYVAFVLITNDGFKIALDDVEVSIEDPVSITEIDNNNFVIYPNPFENNLDLKSNTKIKAIKIYDISGKLVSLQNPKNSSLNLVDLHSGVYFLHATFENDSIYKQKIIKL